MAFPAFAVGVSGQGAFAKGAFDPGAEAAATRQADKFMEEAIHQNDKAGAAFQGTLIAGGKDLADHVRRIDEQEALTYRQDLRNKYMVEGQKAVNEWEPTAYGENALQSPQALQGKLQGIKDRLIENAPSDLARKAAAQELDHMTAQYGVHAENVAKKGHIRWAKDVQAVNEDQNLQLIIKAGHDPAVHQYALDAVAASYRGLGEAGVVYSKEEADSLNQAFEKKAAFVGLEAQLANPKLAWKAINDFGRGHYDDKLNAPMLLEAANKVNSKRDHLLAEARRAQSEARQEAREAAALAKGDIKAAVTIAADTGTIPAWATASLDTMRRAGGSYAIMADEQATLIAAVSSVHALVEEGKFLPFDEQRARLTNMKQGGNDKEYAIRKEAIDHGLARVNRNEEIVMRDPAGFTNPRAVQAVAKTGTDPQADTERVIRVSLETQEQMGIPADKTRIIPLANAQKMAGEFATADEDGKLSILQGLDAYGPYKSKALSELKIDPSAQHALALMDSPDPQARNMARMMVGVNSDNVKLTEDEEKTATKDVLKNALVPAVLKKQGAFMGMGGVERNTYAQEITKAAARISRVIGDPVKAASMLDAAYTTVDDDRLAIALVPKTISETEAVNGFTFLRNSLTESDLSDMRATLVRQRGEGVGSRMFRERLSDINQHGVWVNDGDGFVLYDPVSRQPVAVNGRKKFKISNAQLKDAGRNRPSMTGSVADDIPTFGAE